ncbi:hypothetical protein ASE57_11075 [Sphingomonas sp. Leaf11]|nr:hypothetical protein ASE57_11075 [Sphingomonas sp. Leaf11]
MMIGDALHLVRDTVEEMRRDPVAMVGGLVPLVALSMWGDLGGADVMPLSFLAISITSFILQYVLTRRAMRAGGLLTADMPGNVGGFFGLCFLSNLGILLGFTLFIVPGIWIYARWIASGPILFAEQATVGEALANSAERTRSLLGAIVGATAILYMPFVAGLAASMMSDEATILSPAVSLAINIGLIGSQIAGWYLAVAIYRALQPQPLAEVFA